MQRLPNTHIQEQFPECVNKTGKRKRTTTNSTTGECVGGENVNDLERVTAKETFIRNKMSMEIEIMEIYAEMPVYYGFRQMFGIRSP